MIHDIADLSDSPEQRADVAVIGSGLAGVHAARRLAARGLDVVVLESGREGFDPAIEALNDLRFEGKAHRRYEPGSTFHSYLPEHLRGRNRLRMLGGTSRTWTGKWRAFTEPDFEANPWIPMSDWPIGLADLEPAYRAVAEDYGIGDVFTARRTPRFRDAERRLASFGLQLAVHHWQAETTRVADRFGAELAESRRIRVILRATATQLRLDDALDRVTEVECRSLDGERLSVRAGHVVIAAGGLEAPRILLASNSQRPEGIGNRHDLVGRCYLEHPKEQGGHMVPGPGLAALARDLQSQPRPRFCYSFALVDAVRAEHRLLRHSLYLSPRYESRWARWRRRLGGKRAFRDGQGRVARYRVKLAVEQAPQRNSRVRLGSERDALGVPKLVVDWRFTDLDRRSLPETCDWLRRAFAAAGLGELTYGASPMTLDATMDAAHPMGTTRMADRPELGVVDRDCRVFGTRNLFVASSAVFPTGAVYSPTYTIVGIAHRVAEHIADAVTSKAEVSRADAG